jgi:hypothetical protein
MISDSAKASLDTLVAETKKLVTDEKKRLNSELTMLKAIQSGAGMSQARKNTRDSSLAFVNSSVTSLLT